MATYNGERFIKEQVNSILSQLSEHDELIVSDDQSSDRTIGILKEFNDPRIKLFYNKGKKGVNGNFENSLKKASGQYIFIADQDDVWFTNKVQLMLSYLQEYDLVNCNCEVSDENLNILCSSYFEFIKSGNGFLKNLKKNTYMGNCMAFKRELINLAIPFPADIPYYDWWIALIGELFFSPIFIPEKLGIHRRHGANDSNNYDNKKPSPFQEKILKRLIILKNLPKVYFKKYV